MAVGNKHHATRKLLKTDDRRSRPINQVERNRIYPDNIQSKKNYRNEEPLSWYDLTYSIL